MTITYQGEECVVFLGHHAGTEPQSFGKAPSVCKEFSTKGEICTVSKASEVGTFEPSWSGSIDPQPGGAEVEGTKFRECSGHFRVRGGQEDASRRSRQPSVFKRRQVRADPASRRDGVIVDETYDPSARRAATGVARLTQADLGLADIASSIWLTDSPDLVEAVGVVHDHHLRSWSIN
jgi:hypothetical protein